MMLNADAGVTLLVWRTYSVMSGAGPGLVQVEQIAGNTSRCTTCKWRRHLQVTLAGVLQVNDVDNCR